MPRSFLASLFPPPYIFFLPNITIFKGRKDMVQGTGIRNESQVGWARKSPCSMSITEATYQVERTITIYSCSLERMTSCHISNNRAGPRHKRQGLQITCSDNNPCFSGHPASYHKKRGAAYWKQTIYIDFPALAIWSISCCHEASITEEEPYLPLFNCIHWVKRGDILVI